MIRLNNNIYVGLTAIIAMLNCSGLIGQQKEFDTIQVNVITRFKPTIHDAVKLNNTPSAADSVCLSRNVKYDFVTTQYQTNYTPPLIPAMQIKGEPQEKLYHSLLNAGIGNYNTLYAEYFFNSIRSHDVDYGIHLNHLSSAYTTNNVNSDYAFNNIDGYWKKFFHEHTFSVDAGFQNHSLNDYGYSYIPTEITPAILQNIASPKERFDLTRAALNWESTYEDSSKIGHEIELSYYNFNDIYNATENNFDADMKFFTYFNQQRIDLKAGVGYVNDVNRIENSTDWDLSLNPFFTTTEAHWDAHLGAKVNYLPSDKKANIYPDLLARYHIAQDVVMIYAGIDGNQKLNTYKSLSDRNPFIIDTLKKEYTYTQYHLFAGLAGSITPQLTYDMNVSQSMIKDMPLFITDTLETLRNRFDVVYDNVKVQNFHVDLSYEMKNNLTITLAGDYNIYTPTDQVKAWYNPALKISATGKYTLQTKYILKAEIFYVGDQYAPEIMDNMIAAKTLPGYPDLNLGVEYKYNKSFTAFLNLNNLANVGYYTWDNYEMQRFNFLIGIRFGF
jgi:hypothetical protein